MARTRSTAGVKDLVGELLLMPVEGGARVAIIESADRMNEDAQSALLKTLEEPPAGVTILLCADQEARLLPTVRSRCFRLRLGLSARATSRPSSPTMAWPIRRPPRVSAGSPVAVRVSRWPTPEPRRRSSSEPSSRASCSTSPMPARPPAWPLPGPRSRAPSPWPAPSVQAIAAAAPARPTRRRGPAAAAAATAPAPPPAPGAGPPDDDPDASDRRGGRPRPDPGRRAATWVEILLGLWADVARDLALVGSGGARSVHDTVLLDELSAISAAIPPGSAGAFLARAARSAELLAGNVSPELVLDALVLAWPSRSAAA